MGSLATMLEFFRRYQRSFFLVITFFVVISFSFFGTFNALSTMRLQNSDAFTAVDGSNITRVDIDDMAMFLSSDAEDKLLQGGAWGPNFFNDGVVKKDLFETGIAAILAEKFSTILLPDLQPKLEREKHFQTYVHPKAAFLSADAIWNHFAPDLKNQLTQLQNQNLAISPEALKARIALYLAERRFPEPMLKQVLLYQQKQYSSWLPSDETMLRSDLSLFGYHHLNDWFGSKFIRLVSEFIINSALQAKQLGYEVTREEALADLLKNASLSFQQIKDSPQLGVASQGEYFKLQLQKMNMDQNKAVHLWQQILLFRRLYHNAGALPLVDSFAFQKFGEFAGETVSGKLYTLPEALRLNQFENLQKFETYLKSVSKKESDPLALPTTFYDIEKVSNEHPELVQKRYILEIASVDKRNLHGKVGLQQMWDWQTSDEGWNKIVEQFPELKLDSNVMPKERQKTINELDKLTKNKVDIYSRNQIVDQHTEWLKDALEKANSTRKEVAITLRGGQTPISGLKDNQTFIQFLDSAADGDEKALERLKQFSADNSVYYRINVIQKPEKAEILTFAEANGKNLLDGLVEASLKGYYLTIREKTPERYKLSNGNWKTFNEVKHDLATDYFGIVIKNIRDDALKSGFLVNDALMTEDRAASLRFYKYMRTLREEAEKDPSSIDKFVRDDFSENDEHETGLKTAPPLIDQWKLIGSDFSEARSSVHSMIDLREAFALPLQKLSKINVPNNGDLSFFQVASKGQGKEDNIIRDKVLQAHALLGNEAKQILAKTLIQEMIDKNAISVDFIVNDESDMAEMSPESGQEEI